MSMKCEKCNKTATVHLTEIGRARRSKSISASSVPRRMRESRPRATCPINELLTNFVLAHSGMQKETGTPARNAG